MAQKYGFRANETEAEKKPCLICGDENPCYSWTDLHGEGYCFKCGTPYQLMNGKMDEGETYPRINIAAEWIPILKRYWEETHKGNGSGTFIGWDVYPDQYRDVVAFDAWLKLHPEIIPAKVGA